MNLAPRFQDSVRNISAVWSAATAIRLSLRYELAVALGVTHMDLLQPTVEVLTGSKVRVSVYNLPALRSCPVGLAVFGAIYFRLEKWICRGVRPL
jgi:hypothetical protein